MNFYRCKKSGFTFDPSKVLSAVLQSNSRVVVTYKDSKIGNNGMVPISFDSNGEAKEAHDEISEELVRYSESIRIGG